MASVMPKFMDMEEEFKFSRKSLNPDLDDQFNQSTWIFLFEFLINDTEIPSNVDQANFLCLPD